ncbi:MAG: hypothetical protein ABSG96_26155 [Terracidiphilus sp.]|jgi:hypothetical protein
MRKPVLFAILFALIMGTVSNAVAQSGNFTIAQNGKSVGTASFNFSSTPQGYASTSQVHLDMKGLNYSLAKTESLSAANHLRRVQVSATLNNAAVNVTGAPDTAASAQFLLNVSAGGKSSSARLARHPGAVFLPDFDPGALETLLTLAATNNNRNLWAIIPKQTTAPDGTVQAGSIASVVLATYADEQGTLDSQPITVHHLVASIAGAKTHIFSGPDNQLLQAELPQSGFALVRDGFVLTPPAKPGAPPDQPAPTAAPAPPPVQQ